MIGLSVSLDYKWSLYNLDEESQEYDKAIKLCHKRSAEKLLMGCLNNGGLYVKLGQGLVSMNHILPKEYVDTLVILQDKALSMEPQDVRHDLSSSLSKGILSGIYKKDFCIKKYRFFF